MSGLFFQRTTIIINSLIVISVLVHLSSCQDFYRNCSGYSSERCKLDHHPTNGKLRSQNTGEILEPGRCIKIGTKVNLTCDDELTFFGLRFWTEECEPYAFWPIQIYYCSDKNANNFVRRQDCIVNRNLKRGKWLLTKSNLEIRAGDYIKQNSTFRAVCDLNSTRLDDKLITCDRGYLGLDEDCADIYTNEPNLRWDCKVPEHPKNGKWATADSDTELTPGKFVRRLTHIKPICDKKFKDFSTLTKVTCDLGVWENIDSIGSCEAFCPPLYSTDVIKVTCIEKSRKSENCTDPLEATIAEITCKPIFQNQHIWESRSKFRVCLQGEWDNNILPSCIPKTECGLKVPNLQPLIVNGTEVSKGGYPWHVAIYEKNSLICGGSLISDRLIITAAHCVTDVNGNSKDKNVYELAVGNMYSKFNDSRDKNVQFSSVKVIFVTDAYKGSSKNFAGDLAILISIKTFQLGNGILPVCVNFGTDKLEEKLLSDQRNFGYVPGFGVTETGNVSETLKEIAVPIIRSDKCSKFLPEEFIAYYSYDKFCAGFLNKSTSVCSGDSGGGLVIQNPDDQRFYLTGLVSVSPIDETGDLRCDIQQYALYTSVAEYVDYITETAKEYIQVVVGKNTDSIRESPARRECKKYIESLNPLPVHSHESYAVARALPTEFPFLGIIGVKKSANSTIRWYCAGSLISARFLLTAAHCAEVPDKTSIRVRLGVYNYRDALNASNSPVREFSVDKFYLNPDYHPPQIYNDLALFRLDKEVEFSDNIRPACLITNSDDFPLSQDKKYKSGTWANKRGILVSSQLRVHDYEECNRSYKRLSTEELSEGFVRDVQICVKPAVYKSLDVQNNFCELFGGDAFPILNTDGESNKSYYSIAGVVSYSKDCKKVENLVLYTRISAYVPWIESVVWPSTEPQ